MSYIVRIAKFRTGERFPVLLYAESYQPVVLALRYVIDERRDTKQASTIERDLRVLGWLYKWMDDQGSDLEALMRSGATPSQGQIRGFCRYLRAKRNEIIVGAIGGNNADIISPLTLNGYINTAENYLCWGAREFYKVDGLEKDIKSAFVEAQGRIRRAFRSSRILGQSAPKVGLDPGELAELRRVIAPSCNENPFKPAYRLRNKLIIELFLETGIRRGELLKLQLNHLPVASKETITVRRSPDDAKDPRRNEPQVKTRGREIPISPVLTKGLWEYIHATRKNRNHKFVFASHRRGGPLTLCAVNAIFATLVEKNFPHLKGRLHPHILRHTFNCNLVILGRKMGWSDTTIEETQKLLNGWSEHSLMPAHYTQRLIQDQAMELAGVYKSSLY